MLLVYKEVIVKLLVSYDNHRHVYLSKKQYNSAIH